MNNPLMNTYARLPVTFVRGEGVWLQDDTGKRYLDALSGIGVCALGHAHPNITKAVSEQACKLVHTSNLYLIPEQTRLAHQLCRISGMDKVFFGNSGAEAVEAAIKIARLYGHQSGIDIPTILVAENSFHGRTMATLSATGNRKVQAGFEPLVQGFARIPFNDIGSIRAAAKHRPDIVGILIEPIQGEGGINIPDPGYLRQVRALCDQHGWLMILDEIQTGIGRTGHWFACQHESVIPDIMTLAKALANGVPIGACLARGLAAEIFQPGHHGSTFGGNPLACAAALSTLNTIEEGRLVLNARQMGAHLLKQLHEALGHLPGVTTIRGKGLMIGIELNTVYPQLMTQGLQEGLLFSIQAGKIIRLVPPLILNQQEADAIVTKLTRVLTGLMDTNPTDSNSANSRQS